MPAFAGMTEFSESCSVCTTMQTADPHAFLHRWLSWIAGLHVLGGLALPFLLLRTPWLDTWLPLPGEEARLAFDCSGRPSRAGAR